jgi:phosphoglucosamine mutase
MGKLFGTDGVRGIAGKYPLDEKTVRTIGVAAAKVLVTEKSRSHPILIGCDTRESSLWIVKALKSALSSHGVVVWDLGVIPTPGVAFLVKKYPALAGIVVSASHNPYRYNGIKFFSHKGIKLQDAVELKIEEEIERMSSQPQALRADRLVKSRSKLALNGEYLDFLKSTFPKKLSLKGMKIVIDCANGATCAIAPRLFRSLGAKVVSVNASPDGKNINEHCGSLHPEKLSGAVLENGAECGIAFDGDGDRVMFVDETGEIRDGDFFLSIIAKYLKGKGRLRNNTLVTTVMANLGLFKAMKENGIDVIQTKVGDRYVFEKMTELDAAVGGEQSGHVIFKKLLPTGDGMLSALQFLAAVRDTGSKISELAGVMKKYPQVLLNTDVEKKVPIEKLLETTKMIKATEKTLNSDGRVLVRYSGTENLLRVMIEGLDKKMIDNMAKNIVDTAKNEIANFKLQIGN